MHLRSVFHWTESRDRGHVAVSINASLVEALLRADLVAANVTDPTCTTSTSLSLGRTLERIRLVTLDAGENTAEFVTRRNGLEAQVLKTLGVDTKHWNRAHIE